MRLSPVALALSLLLSGCAIPVNVLTEAIATETTLSGKGSLGTATGRPGTAPAPVLGDGRLVQAGGANVIAAGGGNVIAAGGGNMVAPAAAPVIAAGGGNVIAAGGGNLIVTSGNGVIAAGGMNLAGGGFSADLPTVPNLPESMPGDSPNAGPVTTLDAGTVMGQVLVPGAMVGQAVDLVAVPHTYVGVYDLTGAPVGTPVATDDSGHFRLEGVPAFTMLSLRTVFTYNGHDYYVSSLVRVEATDVEATLSPVSTVAEAEFFNRADGVLPEATLIGSPYLKAFLAGLGTWNGEVTADALAANADLATRAASYAALKMRHPDAFANDIDAAFDHTATTDPTGLTAGEVPAGELAAEL